MKPIDFPEMIKTDLLASMSEICIVERNEHVNMEICEKKKSDQEIELCKSSKTDVRN